MRFVRITASLSYERVGDREDEFLREFESFSSTDSNPVDTNVTRLRARECKGSGPDELTLLLLSELHKKIDELTAIVKGRQRVLTELSAKTNVDFGWYDALSVEGAQVGETYYGRVELPLLRTREIPFFFEVDEEGRAIIKKMWPSDKNDYDAYLASKEREEIAIKKGQND